MQKFIRERKGKPKMYFSDEELREHGVERINQFCYLIPCEKCGRKNRRTQFSLLRTYICEYCRKGIKIIKKTFEAEQNGETVYDRRFASAVKKIVKQYNDQKGYEKAISIAESRKMCYGSIPEAMVAIELVKQKFKIIPQQKIGKFIVDFVIPDLKIILEIDGKIFHKDSAVEGNRDAYLKNMIGLDWLILHVSTDYVLRDVKKVGQYIIKAKEQFSKNGMIIFR